MKIRLLSVPLSSLAAFSLLNFGSVCAQNQAADAGPLFGRLPLVDEIDCGADAGPRIFSEAPPGSSKVETIFGRPCRVLPNEGDQPKFFSYRIGQGKNLKAGAAYLLTVEYPEDKPRAMYILNRGGEMPRGLRTGSALGDTIYTFTNNNLESVNLPLSGKFETWQQLFYLHDRFPDIALPRGDEHTRPLTPADGFNVIIAQPAAKQDPGSAGAAVAKIRLFEVPDPEKYYLELRRPPAGLPQRHIFFREEMADGAVGSKDPAKWATKDPIQWFENKAKLIQFLGFDTYGKDLLEFGSNQGWDSGPNDDWYYRAKEPDRWEKILAMLNKYPSLYVLPYYEYSGSKGKKGYGSQKRSKTLAGQDNYTHIKWTENANADITDPETMEDITRLLDATITKYKDKARFLGAWLRPRPSMLPMSFSDATLERFAKDANGGKAVTREELQKDKNLLNKYYDWWFQERRDFLVEVRDHLRKNVKSDAFVLFTADSSEPGRSLPGGKTIVTDNVAEWEKIAAAPEQKEGKLQIAGFDTVVKNDGNARAQLTPPSTWGQWEWQHSAPQADPANYKNVDGVMMDYSFNNLYTIGSPEAFEGFRSKAGLAITRHYPLNEGVVDKNLLGYFSCDVDRAGPYSVLSEVRAFANGDPTYIGYLYGSALNHGFPQYFRDFNAAFLALPALPSTILAGAASAPDVVVRSIPTPRNGTYLAVANTGVKAQPAVTVKLPVRARSATNAATGANIPLNPDGASVTLDMGPAQLQSLLIQ